MKKVLIIATVVKTHIMTFHLPLLKMLKEKGYEVHVAAKNDYENPEDCKIPYCDVFYDIPFERNPISLNNLAAFYQLKSIIDGNYFEFIHCNTPVGGALTRIASIKTRKKGTKVIYTAHGFHFYKGAPWKYWLLFYPIEKVLSKYTDTLITINQEDYIYAQSFNVKETVYLPGVGINLEKYSNVKSEANYIKNELNLKRKDLILFSTGELNKNKNHEVVLRAIAELNDKSIHYVIAGQGPLKYYLENLAKDLQINNQIHLLGYREDIPKLLRSINLFVFPSYREGLSLSLMEAMAMGKPIIASNIRGNRDLVDENKGGHLFEPKDFMGLSIKLRELTGNFDNQILFGEYNKKKIENYSHHKVIKEMSEIYNK